VLVPCLESNYLDMHIKHLGIFKCSGGRLLSFQHVPPDIKLSKFPTDIQGHHKRALHFSIKPFILEGLVPGSNGDSALCLYTEVYSKCIILISILTFIV
jgi:hypothetical protein